jgi:hypothetical protein
MLPERIDAASATSNTPRLDFFAGAVFRAFLVKT